MKKVKLYDFIKQCVVSSKTTILEVYDLSNIDYHTRPKYVNETSSVTSHLDYINQIENKERTDVVFLHILLFGVPYIVGYLERGI